MTNVPLHIASRYLFARKSHNVINVISAISVIGMAIGTAALILILSVYNGFDNIIKENLSDIDPDFRIVPQTGKYFVPSGEAVAELEESGSVERILEDNIFFGYEERQGIAKAKGVQDSYLQTSGLASHIVEGELKLHFGDVPYACLGSTLSYSNGIHPRFLEKMTLYYPDRREAISIANPTAALNSVKVRPGSIFSISADTDADLMIVPYSVMQELLGCEDEVSALELRTTEKIKASRIEEIMGPGFRVLDRFRQHPALFRMMRYEKAAIYLILIFVIIIIAFNIFGSLSMLIIEKKDDIRTLKAIGAQDADIRKIFILEGWMISLLGLLIGLAVGIALALAQQHFGIVKLPGNYLVQYYPVALKAMDVLLTAAGVAVTGYLIARLSSRT